MDDRRGFASSKLVSLCEVEDCGWQFAPTKANRIDTAPCGSLFTTAEQEIQI